MALFNQQSSFEKFMNEFIPMLVQSKLERDRMKGWLEKSLAEYQAYGQQQKTLSDQGMKNKVLETILDVVKRGSENRPYPELAATETIKRLIPAEYVSGLPPSTEPNLAAKLEAAKTSVRNMLTAQQNMEPVDPNDLQAVVDAFGIKEPAEVTKSIQQALGEKAAQDLRYAELGEAIKSRAVTEKELGLRAEDIGIEKEKLGIQKTGKKTKKELEKSLERSLQKLIDERTDAAEKLAKTPMSTKAYTKLYEPQFFVAKIRFINQNIKKIYEKLGRPELILTPADYADFKARALENKAAGIPIDWNNAILLGVDPGWLARLKDELEGK